MKKKLTKFVILIIIIIISGLRAYGNWEAAIYDTGIGANAYENVGEILNDVVIKQGFHCEFSGLTGFNIRTAALGLTNTSLLIYSVIEENTDKIVAEGTVNAADLKNNSFNEILFPKIDDSKDKRYVLEIRADNAEEEGSVTIFKTHKGKLAGDLTVNGQRLESQSLVLKMVTNRFNIEHFIVFTGLFLYIIFFIKILNKFLK